MTFSRGATLTTAATFGHADTSNLGPTAGNGFYKRWPDDLALLQDIGITDIRLTFDWPRLQPKPGALSSDWSERFEQKLAAADAIGIRVWATLHDGAEPQWITNEGGIDGDDVIAKWWPRYVERIADRFGSAVHGWIPFSHMDADTSVDGWINTWSILGRTDQPVVVSLAAGAGELAASYVDTCDQVGVVLEHGELVDADPTDERLELLAERLHDALMEAAESADRKPLLVSQFTPQHDSADVAGAIVGRLVGAVDAAIEDGADVGVVFLDPAIAGPESPNGLLDSERVVQPAADAFLVVAG